MKEKGEAREAHSDKSGKEAPFLSLLHVDKITVPADINKLNRSKLCILL